MKILVVSQYFWPEQFVVNELCSGLTQLGHEVTVLTGCPNYPEGKAFKNYRPWQIRSESYDGAKVFRVPLVPRGTGGKIRLALNYLSYMISASILGPFLCRQKHDVIFVMQLSPATVGIPAVILKWLKRIPIVFWVQDLWPESVSASGALEEGRATQALSAMMRVIYRNCDKILVQSEAFKPSVTKLAPSDAKMEYLPNWAPSVFDRTSEPSDQSPTFNVVFGGNIGLAQNVETIVAAAEKLREHPKIRFTIIGDGSRAGWMKNEVEKKKLKNVKFLGRQPIEKMPELFESASCLIVTLKSEPIFELTVPSKVQAYFASGKPIIACLDGEGSRVIQEAQAGLCGPCENHEILAKNILTLCEMSDDDREKMGRNGRAYFEKHFRHQVVLNKLDGILSATVESPV